MSENENHWNSTSSAVLKVSLFLAVASHLCSSIYHSHFYEYLFRGHWILENLKFPKSYFLNDSEVTTSWRDPNWVFEILISFIETNFSAKGLIILKISLVFLSLYTSSRLFFTISKDIFFACVLAIFACCGFFVSADLNPSYLSLPLACLVISYLFKAGAVNTNKERGNSSIFTSTICFFLCYFLYNAQTISFIFIAFTALFLGLSKKAVNKKLLLVCILPLFLPPYFGLNLLSDFKFYLSSIGNSILLQSNPASIYDFRFAFLILSWVLAVVIARESKNVDKNLLLFASLVNLLALGHNSILGVALFVNCVVVSCLWKNYMGERANLRHALSLLKTNFQKISHIGLIWVLIAVSVVGIRPKIKYPTSSALLPSKVLDLALERGLKLPLYHDTFSGSYLMYRLPKGSNDAVLNTFQSSSLDQARINFLSKSLHPYFMKFFDFMAPKSVICRVSDPLFSLLKRDSSWIHINSKQESNFSWALFEKK